MSTLSSLPSIMDRLQHIAGHLESVQGNKEQGLAASCTAAEQTKLVGRCACGSVSWEGLGDPAVTFYCHCSLCRRSGGAPFVGAAAFKPENVIFHGEANIRDFIPPNSRVPRRFCKKCGTYVAEDARPVLGVYALPIGLCQETPNKKYWPAQHIFYDSRIIDIDDSLPKFLKMPDGPRAD